MPYEQEKKRKTLVKERLKEKKGVTNNAAKLLHAMHRNRPFEESYAVFNSLILTSPIKMFGESSVLQQQYSNFQTVEIFFM